MQRQIEVQLLFDNGYHHVGSYGDPHLTSDGVLGSAEEALDAQVLLDPFEQRYDILPTRLSTPKL